ncbi:DNA primase [Prosthecobacter sp.]|uniref:DNA primase n=1 Tax=Prosthecobacter sp. TaxID=1965333 RepID=UPI002AB89032|nr:DNA primase [Prosthecobacter sp.]MDZ4405579.1 DNA primase [Prosthecobacter sp.]
MSRIPEETIQQVIAATDIVALVGRSVKLRKAGTNYLGLCPFHNERTPSFNVSPSRNTYHCFGCGAGGTAIRFVMEHDGLSFVEAVKRLADAAGIRVEEEVWDANAEAEAKQRSLLLRANREAAEWFHQLLMKHQLAAPAREYLKSRGITAEVAKNWQMGYAPQSTTFYREWMAQQKLPEQVMVEAGIFVQPTEDENGQIGRPYARWRHRLMFPIRNDNSDVIAFSGRILSAEQKGGKYVNSPETPLFSKSRVLFGFDRSKRPISKAGEAIVCEGQIDMIMLYEAGFQNVVAGQGTAFTDLHAKLLKRVCNEIVLCYDSDNAGYAAAEKAFKILSPIGLTVKVAALPQGEDPDSLLRKQGKDALQAVLGNATDFLEYQIRRLRSSAKSDGMVERVRMAEQVAAAISIFTGVAQRITAVNKVAKLLEISEEQLNAMVKRAANEQKRNAGQQKADSTVNVVDEAKKLLSSQHKTAVLLCQMALNDAEVMHWLRESNCEDMLREVPGTELLSLLVHSRHNPSDETSQLAFMAGLEKHQEAAFAQLQAGPRLPGSLEDAKASLYALEFARLQSLIQGAQSKLRQPGLSEAEMERLQQQVVELSALRKECLDRTKGTPNSFVP